MGTLFRVVPEEYACLLSLMGIYYLSPYITHTLPKMYDRFELKNIADVFKLDSFKMCDHYHIQQTSSFTIIPTYFESNS